jgi:hypothetical protein
MKTKHQFHVRFVNGAFFKTVPLTDNLKQAKEICFGLILRFFKKQFTDLQDDEQQSINKSFEKGNTFVILGTDAKGAAFHIIGSSRNSNLQTHIIFCKNITEIFQEFI